MFLFGKKTKLQIPEVSYDPAMQKAVLKCSICNGEQVAGFKDLQTGKIKEVMFIRSDHELQAFMEKYGLTEIEKIY